MDPCLCKDGQDPFVFCINCRFGRSIGVQRHTEADCDFLEPRLTKASFATCSKNPLNAASPLLDKPKFVKNPSDDPIPQFGNAVAKVLNRESEREESRILNL